SLIDWSTIRVDAMASAAPRCRTRGGRSRGTRNERTSGPSWRLRLGDGSLPVDQRPPRVHSSVHLDADSVRDRYHHSGGGPRCPALSKVEDGHFAGGEWGGRVLPREGPQGIRRSGSSRGAPGR